MHSLLFVILLGIANFSIGAAQSFYSASYESLITELDFDIAWSSSLFNALNPVLAIFGGPIVNIAVRFFGRKFPSLVSTLIVIVGWIFIAITKRSYKVLAFIGRGIVGLGIGGISTVIPVYIAELAPSNSRGGYGTINSIFTALGELFVYFLGIWLKWKVISGLCLIIPIIDLILIICAPESPVVSKMREDKISNRTIFHFKYMKPVFLSFFIVFFSEFSGMSAVLANLNPIFITSEITIEPSVASTIVICSLFLSVLTSTPLVDRLGRKVMWITSSFGQALFLILLWANEKYVISKTLPIICLFFYLFFNGIGLLPLPDVVIPEIFPDEVRPFGMGASQVLRWALCSINVFSFRFMTNSLSLSWTWFFYFILTLVSGLFGIFFLPEMKGRVLGQKRRSLFGNKNERNSSRDETRDNIVNEEDEEDEVDVEAAKTKPHLENRNSEQNNIYKFNAAPDDTIISQVNSDVDNEKDVNTNVKKSINADNVEKREEEKFENKNIQNEEIRSVQNEENTETIDSSDNSSSFDYSYSLSSS